MASRSTRKTIPVWSSGNPATFFNTKTLEAIKTIPAPGADGYLFDAPTHHFFILSHRAPNLLVVDSKDGSIVGKVEAIGPDGANAAVEQGVTDGEGHLYFDVANAHHIAVVDAKTLKVTGHFDLGEKGNGPAGLAIDTKNHILFAMCRGGRRAGHAHLCHPQCGRWQNHHHPASGRQQRRCRLQSSHHGGL